MVDTGFDLVMLEEQFTIFASICFWKEYKVSLLISFIKFWNWIRNLLTVPGEYFHYINNSLVLDTKFRSYFIVDIANCLRGRFGIDFIYMIIIFVSIEAVTNYIEVLFVMFLCIEVHKGISSNSKRVTIFFQEDYCFWGWVVGNITGCTNSYRVVHIGLVEILSFN